MVNQILKELFKVYSEIPVGMLVFKGGELFFVNKHLRETLMLGAINTEDSLNIICTILNIDTSSKELYTFLQENSFLSYKDKHIQIASKNISEYSVFIFTPIDKSLLEEIKEPLEVSFVPIVSDNNTVNDNKKNHKKLLDYFDKKRKQKIRGYSLYKGVPLIADNIIKQKYKNTLVIKVEDKQMIAAQKGMTWIFITPSGRAIEGTIVFVSIEKRLIFLNNLNKIEKGFHLRETIRYQSEKPIDLIIKSTPEDIELKIVDINDSTFRVITNNQVILEKLVAQNIQVSSNIIINNETVKVKTKFLFEAVHSESESAVVMEYFCNETQHSILRNWFNERQIEIIKEVKEFSNRLF